MPLLFWCHPQKMTCTAHLEILIITIKVKKFITSDFANIWFSTSVCGRSKSVGRGRFMATDHEVDLDRPTENDFFPDFFRKNGRKLAKFFVIFLPNYITNLIKNMYLLFSLNICQILMQFPRRRKWLILP